jgi:hypothetical protein
MFTSTTRRSPGGDTRPRSIFRTGLVLGTLALGLLLAGCGSSKHVNHALTGTTAAGKTDVIHVTLPDDPSPTEIRRSALLTAAEAGYRAKVSAAVTIPQFRAGPLTANGSGYFDSASGTGTVNIVLKLPGLLGLAGPLPSKVVAVGSHVYVKLPDDLATAAPTLKAWQEASLKALDLSTLSPSVILGQVARDATKKIPDQQAKVTIDPKTDLIRTIVLTYYVPGPRIHVAIHLTLTGFGKEPVSSAPPPSQVGQLLPALKALGL